MDRIIEQLPEAQKWALFFIGATVISLLGSLVEVNIFGIIISALLLFFTIKYRSACKVACDSEDVDDLAEACRWQKNILIVQGVQAALLLLVLIVAIIGISLAIIIPMMNNGASPM